MRLPLRSLRARVLLVGLAGTVLGGALGAVLLGAAFGQSVERALDRRLADDLAVLVGRAYAGPGGQVHLDRAPTDERFSGVFSGWYWQVGAGSAALRSRSLWDVTLPDPTWADGTARTGGVGGPLGQRLRVRAQAVRLPGARGAVWFQVAADTADLRAETGDFRMLAGAAVATIVGMFMAALLAQVTWGLRPLRQVRSTLDAVRRGREERFDAATLPREVAPLAAEINALLDAHTRRVQRARAAAQDLAHALKTPLAVLEAQFEHVAAPEVTAQLARLRASIEHHLATTRETAPAARTAVGPVAQELRGALEKIHAARAVQIRAQAAADAVFAGSPEDLQDMLGNLLDNACKWAGGAVSLTITRAAGGLLLQVDDDGPGLDAAQAAHALARGVRLDEAAPGSGLGLAIAHRLAVSYGGSLRLLRAPTGGLRAELELPAAD